MGEPVGVPLPPGGKFTKVWRMRNEGESAWENAVLAFVGGDQLGALESVTVPPVAPGEEIDLKVDMVAPSVPGRYVSFWRLCTPEGYRFGHRIWVDIIVREQSQPQPEPEPVPAPQPMEEIVASSAPRPLNPAEQLEAEFLHLSMASLPHPQSVPVVQASYVSEPVCIPQPPIAIVSTMSPVPVDSPVVPQPMAEYVSPAEAESLQTLKDMGFQGDLLQVLRKYRGDLLEAVRELLGN